MKFRFPAAMIPLICTVMSAAMVIGFSAVNATAATANAAVTQKLYGEPFIKDAFSGTTLPRSVVMATGEWAPYTSKKLDRYGLFTEIVTAVFEEMGIAPRYRFYPWKRCEKEVRDDDVWAAFPYLFNKDRAKIYVFSDPVATSRFRFFYYKNKMKNVSWDKLEDLRPYKIGGVLGYYYEGALKKAKLNVEYTNKEILAIKKLMNNRIDLFPMEELVGWDIIRRNFPDEVQNFGTLKKPLSGSLLHLIIKKGDKKSVLLLNRFNNALKRIKENGTYKSIFKEHHINID